MTESEFLSISKEIRRLILPSSKILLLGRPDAIVSGEEHAVLMKGIRTISNVEIADDIMTQFEEIRLDFFSKSEYLNFLARYLTYFCSQKDKTQFIDKRLSEVKRLKLDDLIRRPVQAKMLAQIILNPKNSIEKISRYDLYNLFIDDCLTREEEKPQRRNITRDVRRQFMQDLAWWLWAIKRTRTFTVQDIPNSQTRCATWTLPIWSVQSDSIRRRGLPRSGGRSRPPASWRRSSIYGRTAGDPAPSTSCTTAATTVAESERAVRLFTELHGDMVISAIRRSHAHQFREALQDVPRHRPGKLASMSLPALAQWGRDNPSMTKLNATTVNKQLGAVQAVCRWAHDKGGMVSDEIAWADPFARQRLPTEEPGRESFTSGELNAIFAGAIFTTGERPAGGKGEAAFWGPCSDY
jgi:hypothetical protein